MVEGGAVVASPVVAPATVLAVENLVLRFGGVVVLDGVSFGVVEGEIFSLIGPNGAGKSSLFNCLSRLYTPSAGSVVLYGHDLLDVDAHEVVGLGLARTFQSCALFPTMTVAENVVLGAYRRQAGAWRTAARRIRPRGVANEHLARTYDLLAYLGLSAVADRHVAELDYPSQKRVELARALMTSPSVLLLDEPAGGLTVDEADEISRLIRDIRDRLNITVVLVEHRMTMVMSLSDRVCVLDSGKVIANGVPQAVADDPVVIDAYLGTSHADPGRSP